VLLESATVQLLKAGDTAVRGKDVVIAVLDAVLDCFNS
jgi:hypothetical protein